MSSEKKKYLSITTPIATARYPKLNKPETEVNGKPVDPRYTCAVVLSGDEVAPIKAKLEAKLKEVVAEFKANNPKKAKSLKTYLPIRPLKDKEGEVVEDQFVLSAKTLAEVTDRKTKEVTKRRVPVFDSIGRPIKPTPNVGSGSKIRMAFTVGQYDKDDRDGTEVGLTLYLDAVQVIELVEYGGEGNAERYGFGKEEGGFTGSQETDEADDLPETDEDSAEAEPADNAANY